MHEYQLFVPLAFCRSCPDFYLFGEIQHLGASYMRLMAWFHELDGVHREINRKPDNSNPSPKVTPTPSARILQDSCAHRLALGERLTQIVKFK